MPYTYDSAFAGSGLVDPVVQFTGAYKADQKSLRPLLEAEREALESNPPKPERSASQQAEVATARAAAVRCRREFLRVHGSTIYDEVTGGRRRSLRLNELAVEAAALIEGLVPTAAELALDRCHMQVDKDGRELELGLLFWSFLRSPESGRHLQHSMQLPTPRALAALPAFRANGVADFGLVTVERSDGIAEITIRNERYLNAEDDDVVDALEAAVDLVLMDELVKVGILRGAPMSHPAYKGRRVFSSGINLTHLYAGQISLLDFLLRRELGYISKLYRGLTGELRCNGEGEPAAEKPWVGAIDTFAIGGGAQLTLVLDHVVAEKGAFFSLPALQEGLIPGVSNLRLTRIVGARAARAMIFGNRQILADSSDGRLLCDDAVASEKMDEAIRAAAGRLDNRAVIANRRMMHLAEEPLDVFRCYMASYALEQSQRLYSADLLVSLEQTWVKRRKRLS